MSQSPMEAQATMFEHDRMEIFLVFFCKRLPRGIVSTHKYSLLIGKARTGQAMTANEIVSASLYEYGTNRGGILLLKQATELANFLTGNNRSAEEIAKFMVLKTFSTYLPSALYIAEITDDGYLSPVGGFGFEKTVISKWGRFPLNMHLPITDSVRTDRCILIDNIDEFFENYPILDEIEGVPIDWEAVLAWPMLPFGVGFALLEKVPCMSEEFENYLRLTGAVIALHLLRAKNVHHVPEFRKAAARKGLPTTLSNRQKVILEMLTKGSTNSEIALEIGYSESLVRQETIEIYQILGVSGRKELITAAGAK